MQKAIENFCEKKNNGLFLLDMPTGFGKTYNVLEFIAENFDNDKYKNTNFFFVTTLKKNLPFEDLRERFKLKNKEKQFEEKCIRIEANAEKVIENIDSLYKSGKIPKRITLKKEFQELLNHVQFINQFRNKDLQSNYETFAKIIKEKEILIQKTAEPNLRKLIIEDLSIFKSPKDKLDAIKDRDEYKWIGKLYPTVFSTDKQIFFLTIDKFILGNTTIIEPTYSFYNHSIIQNAIIFIDEFDATKDKVLNLIINKGLNQSVDYLYLFDQINSALTTKSFPIDVTTDSTQNIQNMKERFSHKSCEEILKGCVGVFEDTSKKFNMKYSFLTKKEKGDERTRNFLFNDLTYHSVLSKKSAYIDIIVDHKAQQNWIHFTKQKMNYSQVGILPLLSSIKGCLTYFQNGCRHLAENYKQLQNERNSSKNDDFTLEDAITSVLKVLNISKELIKYLTPLILSEQKMNRKKQTLVENQISPLELEHSIYNNGFRYYDFKDDPSHNMQSEIRLYDFSDTPEKILLRIAQKARVIGISATATIDTVIGNYSQEYLKRMLQDDYYALPREDRERLENAFAESTKNYSKVDIQVNPISCDEEIRKDLEKIYDNERIIDYYAEKLEMHFGTSDFAIRRFLKIIKAMKAFIVNDEVQSFLCLCNKLTKEGKTDFDLILFREMARDIIEEAGLNYDEDKLVVSINSEDYDTQYNEIIERLSNGKKLFVLSSYQTIGAGQNLQYRKPENVDVVQVNDNVRELLEKDFDCIYLEKPTNIVVNVFGNKIISEETLVRFIFEMEFLMENNEVSRAAGIHDIKEIFKKSDSSAKANLLSNRYESCSIQNASLRVLIQAVGRICRTGLKNKNIYIYLDEAILKEIDMTAVKTRMVNPEFAEIIKEGKKYDADSSADSLIRIENQANGASLKSMLIINKLRYNWDEKNINLWKRLREQVLKHPTIDKHEIEKNLNFKSIYLQAPKKISGYSYSQEDDYQKNIMVKFDDSMPQKVSEEDARLQEILEIPGIKAYFEEKGYATEFTSSEYLLTPPMFNNIYKGALGEVAGKYILEKFLGCELQEVSEDVFEFFDFKIGDDVYVDFKHWKDTMIVDAKKAKEKIIQKLNACNGKRAVIINILYDREMQITTSYDERIVEIPCLYRTDLNQLDPRSIDEILRKGYLR